MESDVQWQCLNRFAVPEGFRGRNPFVVQLWWIVQGSLFRYSPQFAYSFRAFLLRLFGAKVGRGTVIRPSVKVTYPWKVEIGDWVWIGDQAELYSLGDIVIGANSVVSQRSYLCAAGHDYRCLDFPLRERAITIKDQVWIAADVFVAPGVTIGRGCVVGARSSVFGDLPEGMVCMGMPCKPVRPR